MGVVCNPLKLSKYIKKKQKSPLFLTKEYNSHQKQYILLRKTYTQSIQQYHTTGKDNSASQITLFDCACINISSALKCNKKVRKRIHRRNIATCSDSLQLMCSSRWGCEDTTDLPNLSLLKLKRCPHKKTTLLASCSVFPVAQCNAEEILCTEVTSFLLLHVCCNSIVLLKLFE